MILALLQVALFASELGYIDIKPPYNSNTMEYSGLTQYKDEILFLPQYPKGFILSQSKANILNEYDKKEPLELQKMTFDDSYFKQEVCKSEGYEAIACNDEYCYFTVESRSIFRGMMSYLLKAKIENKTITVEKFIELPIYSQIENASYEAIILDNHKVMLFYEGNGANITHEPYYLSVSEDLEEVEKLPFTPVEYRLTDATQYANSYYFINYLWLGDKLNYRVDNTTHVEDIIVLDKNMKETKKYHLPLETQSRNWEGIEMLDKHRLLLITDMFHKTLVGVLDISKEENATH